MLLLTRDKLLFDVVVDVDDCLIIFCVMNLNVWIDCIKRIEEFIGEIDNFIADKRLKLFGKVNFIVLVTFWEMLPVVLCNIVLEIGLGTLASNANSEFDVTKLLSL